MFRLCLLSQTLVFSLAEVLSNKVHVAVDADAMLDMPPEDRPIIEDNAEDESIMKLLQQRARFPSDEDRENSLKHMLSDYPEMGSEEELLEVLSKVDARTELSVFHKNRRRDPNGPACEDDSPSDADDKDCHIRRYQMLMSLFPVQEQLHNDNENLKFDVEELSDEWAQLDADLDKEMTFVWGLGGSRAAPSKTDGLVSKISVLSQAVWELHSALLASANELWAEHERIYVATDGDINLLKDEMATALQNLINGIQQLESLESQVQFANTVAVNAHGNTLLTQAVDDINENQGVVEQNVQAAATAMDEVETATQTAIEETGEGLDDLESEITGEDARQAEMTEGAQVEARRQMMFTQEDLGTYFREELADYDAAVNTMNADFNQETRAAIQESTDDWKAQQASTQAEGEQQLALEQQRLDDVQDAFTAEANQAQADAAAARDEFQTQSDDMWDAQTGATEEMNAEISALVATLETFSQDNEDLVQGISDSTDEREQEMKADLSRELFAVSGSVGDALLTLVDSLSDAESDMTTDINASREKVTNLILELYRANGEDDVKMAGVIASLMDLIDQGENTMSSSLDALLSSALDAAGNMGDGLQESVDEAAQTLGETAEAGEEASTSLMEQLKASISDGNLELAAEMLTMASNAHAEAQSVRDMIDGNQEQFMSELGDAGDTTEYLQQALYELAEGDADANSEIFSMNTNLQESVSRLATLLGTQESDIADHLQSFMTESTERTAEAMQQEGDEAEREFNEIENTANQGVQEYLSGAQQTSSDLEGQLQVNQHRNEMYENELSEIDQAVLQLIQGNEVDMEALMSSFIQHLAENKASNEAEVQQISAQLAQSTGQLEESLYHMLDTRLKQVQSGALDLMDKNQQEIEAVQKSYLEEQSETEALANKLENDEENFHEQTTQYEELLQGINNSVAEQDREFEYAFRDLMDKFGVLSTHETTQLQDLTATFEQKIAELPQMLSRSDESIQEEFLASAAEIEAKITELQNVAANADTEAERLKAEQELEILNQIHALSEKVKASDAELKAQMEQGEEANAEQIAAIQSSMKNVVASLDILSAHIDSEDVALTGEVNEIGQRSTLLFQGLESAIQETDALLERELSQAEMQSEFEIEYAQSQDNQELDALAEATDEAKHLVETENAELLALQEAEKNNITRVYGNVQAMRENVEKRIGAVMDELAKSQSMVETAQEEQRGDVYLKLGLVRQAVKNFLELWNEYAAVTTDKLNKVNQRDQEFITHLSLQVDEELDQSKGTVQEAMDKVSAVDTKLDEAHVEEVNFEQYMTEHLDNLSTRQAEIHTQRDELLAQTRSDLADLTSVQEELDAQERQAARDAIAEFEAEINDKVELVLESAGVAVPEEEAEAEAAG